MFFSSFTIGTKTTTSQFNLTMITIFTPFWRRNTRVSSKQNNKNSIVPNTKLNFLKLKIFLFFFIFFFVLDERVCFCFCCWNRRYGFVVSFFSSDDDVGRCGDSRCLACGLTHTQTRDDAFSMLLRAIADFFSLFTSARRSPSLYFF